MLEVYFDAAISKCKVQHMKKSKSNLNWVAGASYKLIIIVGKIGFYQIPSPEVSPKPLQHS